MRALFPSLPFFLLPAVVFSQVKDTLPDGQLAQVVVTAQFAPADTRETVNSVRLLTRNTIEQRAAANLEELLQTEANLRLNQDPVLGASASINGLRGENVKILVDGVPVVGRLNGSVDPGQLQLGAVQQVEIIEGAQSLLYGSEASAGVVNLITRKSQPYRFEAETNAQQESNSYRNLQGRMGARFGKFFVQITGNQLDFHPEADTSTGRDQIWNPKTQTNGRAMLRFSPSDKIDFRLSGGLFHEKVDNLGILRRPKFKPYAFDDYYYTDRADATLHAEGWLPGRLFWQTTVGWNRFDRQKNSYRIDFESNTQELLEGQQDTSAATGLLTRATLASDRRDRSWNFLVGIENYAESAEGIRIVDTSATSAGKASGNDLGVFGSAKVTLWKNLTLQGGARLTQNQLYGAAVTPSFWALWKPAERWKFRFSYANGFRSPGLKELYFNFIDVSHYIIGNTNLQPEHSDNLRAEINWQKNASPNTTWGVTTAGFYNTVRDRIILAEYTAGEYTYLNIDRWKTMGGSLGLNFSAGNFLRFRSEAVATGFYNTYASDTDTLPTLNWSVDWVNDLTLNFWKGILGCSIWHKRTGVTPFFFEENDKVVQGKSQAWNMLNFSVSTQAFDKRVRLNAGVKNITDTRLIRSGSNEAVHSGNGASLQPVHWGRTYFVSAVLWMHTKN